MCLASILLGTFSLGGCSPREQVASENVITLRLGSQDVAEAKGVLTDLLFAEPLLVMDWHGRPGPWLSTGSPEWLEEGRALKVALRSDVKFHDGSPMTAASVAAILRQRVKADPRRLFEYVTAIDTPDEHTLVFRLSRADAFLPAALAGTAIVNDGTPDIGTGPFRLLSRTPLIQAARNGGYYRGTPGIDRVQIITYDTQRAAWAAMMRGDVDMVQEVNREVVEFLEGSSRFEMYSSIRHFYIPLVFNLRHPILRHVEVRRALVEAIDREQIVNEVMRGRGQIADDPIWPSHWAYNSAARKHSYNPQAARVRLDAAGFPVRRPSESEMASRFQLKCLFYNKDSQFERIAMMLQRQLADVGVELVLEGADTKVIIARAGGGDFDSYLFQMTSGKSFDWTYRFWHSPTAGAAYQDTGYAGADEVLDRLRQALLDSDVRAAVADLRQRFHEDVPAAFLAWPETTRAVDARFDVGDPSESGHLRESVELAGGATRRGTRGEADHVAVRAAHRHRGGPPARRLRAGVGAVAAQGHGTVGRAGQPGRGRTGRRPDPAVFREQPPRPLLDRHGDWRNAARGVAAAAHPPEPRARVSGVPGDLRVRRSGPHSRDQPRSARSASGDTGIGRHTDRRTSTSPRPTSIRTPCRRPRSRFRWRAAPTTRAGSSPRSRSRSSGGRWTASGSGPGATRC